MTEYVTLTHTHATCETCTEKREGDKQHSDPHKPIQEIEEKEFLVVVTPEGPSFGLENTLLWPIIYLKGVTGWIPLAWPIACEQRRGNPFRTRKARESICSSLVDWGFWIWRDFVTTMEWGLRIVRESRNLFRRLHSATTSDRIQVLPAVLSPKYRKIQMWYEGEVTEWSKEPCLWIFRFDISFLVIRFRETVKCSFSSGRLGFNFPFLLFYATIWQEF